MKGVMFVRVLRGIRRSGVQVLCHLRMGGTQLTKKKSVHVYHYKTLRYLFNKCYIRHGVLGSRGKASMSPIHSDGMKRLHFADLMHAASIAA